MPLVVYSALRVALIGVALLALFAAGLRGWLLVLVAAVVAAAASYAVLGRPRDAAASWLAERSARRQASGVRVTQAIDDDARAEDAEADGGQIASPRPSSTP